MVWLLANIHSEMVFPTLGISSDKAKIVGIELDAQALTFGLTLCWFAVELFQVIRLAKKHFNLDALKIEVVHMDALDFLRQAWQRLSGIFQAGFESVRKHGQKWTYHKCPIDFP